MLIMNLKTMFFRYSMFALSRDLQNIQKDIYDKDDDTAEVEEEDNYDDEDDDGDDEDDDDEDDDDEDDDGGGDEDSYRDLKQGRRRRQ